MKNGAPTQPPGKNAGPAPRSPRLPRGHGQAVCRRMHSRTETTSTAGDTVLPRVAYRRQKPEFPADDFLAEPVSLSHRYAAALRARASAILLAGVEATSPRTYK